jgi:hypothetical protein
MGSITIRLAEDSDNEKIMGLARKCPQQGMITFFVNRTPRFNSLHKLLDPGAWHYVACKDDQIIGLVGVMHFQGKVLGMDSKIGYMLDLRLLEEYRSGLTAFRLVKTAVDHLRQSDADMVIVNFLKDNKSPMVFTSGRGGLPAAHFLGENAIFNLLPMHKMKLDKRFSIELLSEKDIPELIDLYNRYAKGFKIAPVFTEERFRRNLNSLDGFSLDKFIVAKENGKIKAVTATWDEHIYKSYQILKLNFTINVVTRILKFLSMFMKVPNPVRINEPLRQLSLVMYAHDDCPEALDTLFRHVNNTQRGSEYTLITIYAQVKDPIFRLLQKYKGISVQSEMYLFAKDPSIFQGLDDDKSPVLFDMIMIQ